VVDCPGAVPAFFFVEFGSEVTVAGGVECDGEEQGGVKEKASVGRGVPGEEGGREGGLL